MQNQKDSRLLAMTLGGVLFMALVFITSPLWVSAQQVLMAPQVTEIDRDPENGTVTLTGNANNGVTVIIRGGEREVITTTPFFEGKWTAVVEMRDSSGDEWTDLTIQSVNSLGETSAVTRFSVSENINISLDDDDDEEDSDNDNDVDNDNNTNAMALVLPGIVYTQ